LLLATAQAGAAATELGLSPTEISAATTVQSGIAGGPEQGGQLTEALLRSIEKVGIVQKGYLKRGRTLPQYIGDIAGLEKRGISPWESLGARGEAVKAYRNLRNNMDYYNTVVGQIQNAEKNNAMQTMVGLGKEFPELALPQGLRAAQAGEELAGERAGERGSLEQTLMAERVKRVRARGGSELDVTFEKMWNSFDRFISRFGGDDQFLSQAAGLGSPETQKAIADFIEAGRMLKEGASAHAQRSKAAANVQPE
jgi:hypothetical protein